MGHEKAESWYFKYGKYCRSYGSDFKWNERSGALCGCIQKYRESTGFCRKIWRVQAYGSYEELAADEQVDLVYVATPMSEHYENVNMLLRHGRNVLCEKSFALNEKQAAEMFALAKEKKLLLTEAIWVRYMPMWKTLKEVLESGVIGKPMTVTANLCYLIDQVPRLMSLELGGGALLDVGVYVMNFASLVFGDEIEKITSTAVMTDTGVDAQNSITLTYPGGEMAVLNSSFGCFRIEKVLFMVQRDMSL